ncbi:MAG TPA: efflux RND transporter permease subunit [Vicinamibacterales bacterium]|nr:efflux RND transporter permease subunit [Vicinamibacterales bacterium]
MFDALIHWSLRNRALVLALAGGFLLWGGYVTTRMPIDVLPDLTAPTVTTLAEAPGMAPTDMETLVTFPIEAALNGAAGVRRVRSATAVGVSVIWTEFEWGEDIYRARQTVTEKLGTVADSLPAGIERPVLAPVSSIMGEILFVSLESEAHDAITLRTVADTVIRRRLLAVPGVSQVIVTGGGEKQYQVIVDPAASAHHAVTLTEIETALAASSQNTSAGFRVAGGQEYLVQALGRVRSIDDLGQSVIGLRGGRPVLIRDVATVQVGEALKRGEGSHNGKPAVILGIQKQPAQNTIDLTRALDAALDDIQTGLPAGMKIDKRLFRQADFIEIAIHNLLIALRDGGLLVVLTVLLFLANLRAAAISLVAIPLSLVAAIFGLELGGFTINSMTLGGMAIAVGALVDDAIIAVENVFRRLREQSTVGESERRRTLDVVYTATAEIRGSIVFATVIILLVFLPIFFLSGVEGRLLQPLGYAYVIALVASLVVALTVTPVLCAVLLPRTKAVRTGHEPRVIRALKSGYRPILDLALRRASLVVAAAVLLVLATIVGFLSLGRSFLPEFNEGALTVSAVTLPGTSLAESNQLGAALERLLLTVPEVASTSRRTGRAELDEHVQGVESAELDVRLDMRDRPKEEVVAEIRDKATLIPGMNVTVGQPISHRIDHMLSGTRANIAMKVFGDDLTVLRVLARQVEGAAREVPGVVDLSTEQQTDIPTVAVTFDRSALAAHGLPAGEAAEALKTGMVGREVGRLVESGIAVPVVVKYAAADVSDLDVLRRTPIDAAGGVRASVGGLAQVTEDRGPNFISRENVQRKIVVQCNVSGRDLGSVVSDLQRQIATAVPMPQGYRIEYSGQFESAAAATRLLYWLGLAVLAGIAIILSTVFRSITAAAIIMVNLPLALIGGVIGVWLTDGILSVASLIGFIALFGIATRNGIMLVSHIKHLQEQEGVTDFHEAVSRGAMERLAPILMTAMATALALVPIALGAGEPGSEIQAPMAVVILAGLFSATVLNMVVVPAAYWLFARHEAIGRPPVGEIA